MEIILGKTAGFCNGVKRAVDGCFEQLKNDKHVYCLGELVHNKQVVSKLQENGAILIEDLDEIKDTQLKVIVRAHGISNEVYEKAKNHGVKLIDYTCPNVLKIHEIVKEYREKGFYIFLTVSDEKHPEVIGIKSFCGENYSLIKSVEEVQDAIKKFENTKITQLLLVSQTTYSMKKFNEIEQKIKEMMNENTVLIVNNTICSATQIRQEETEKIASEVDKMIIIGGKNSSNTQKLFEIASRNCKEAICIETKNDLEKEDFSKINRVGIMAGASTPSEAIEEIIQYLSEK